MVLAILLYGQFIHRTQINLCPNMQFLSTQQRAYWLKMFTLRTNTDSSYFHGLSASLYKPLLSALTVLMIQRAV